MKKIFLLFVIVAFATLGVNAQFSFVMEGVNTPVANLNSSAANDTICEGDAVLFTAATSSGSTYEFFVNGSSVQGPGGSNTYIPSAWAANDYEVVVQLDNGSCTSMDTINFVVLALPVPTLVSDAAANTACDGDLVTFTAGGGNAYEFFVNGSSVQGPATTNTYATSTLADGDIVTVEVGNGYCSDVSGGVTMTINALPTPTLVSDATGNEACDGTTVTFTATGGVTYEFFVNGSSVQGPGVSDTYITSSLVNGDVVVVEATNANGCSDISGGITMTIHDLPSITSVTGNVGSSECVGSLAPVEIVGLTGSPNWTLEIYNDAAGSPGTLYYSVPGTISTSNATINIPVPAAGYSTLHLRITDSNGCSNF